MPPAASVATASRSMPGRAAWVLGKTTPGSRAASASLTCRGPGQVCSGGTLTAIRCASPARGMSASSSALAESRAPITYPLCAENRHDSSECFREEARFGQQADHEERPPLHVEEVAGVDQDARLRHQRGGP